MGERPVAVIACGALAADARLAGLSSPARPVEVHSLSARLHNRPSQIAPAVEELARSLQEEGKTVVLAYADCGTYGALDEVCAKLGLRRLEGSSCYDVMAGSSQVARWMEQQAGTYLLTDFLLKGFRRLVVSELGLDAHPELVADYFGNYSRIIWITSTDEPALMTEALRIAELLGLELEVHRVGPERPAGALRDLIESAGGCR